MAETIGEAWVEIKPKTDNFGKDVEREVGGISQKLGSGFQKVGIGLTAAVTAPLIGLGAMAVKEATEARAGLAQMEAVIKSTGNAANVTAKEQTALATSLGKMAGIEDDVVMSGQNMLRTFTNVRNETGKGNDVFNQATATILDMSAALGQDTSASAMQLGKALNDPIKGVTALQRVGVTFTEAQKKQITTMAESGDVMGAQKIILAELAKEFGGSAKAAGDALGPAEKFKLTMADIGGQIGAILLPFLDKLAAKFSKIADWFGNLGAGGQKMVLMLAGIAAAAGPVLIVVGQLIKSFGLISKAFTVLSFNPWVIGLTLLAGALVLAWKHSETFRDVVRGAFEIVKGALGSVVDAWTNFKNAFLGFEPSGLFGKIGSAAGLAFEHIKMALSSLKAWWDGIWPQISEAVAHAMNFISAVISGVVAFVSALWRMWGDDILTVAKGIWTAVSGVISGAVQVIGGIIRTVLAIINGDWSAAGEGLKAIARGIWTAIQGIIGGALGVLRGLIGAALAGIAGIFSGAWHVITSGVSAAFNFVRNTILGAINAARAGVGSAINSVIGFFSHLWERAQYYVRRITEAIRSLPFVPGSPIPMVVWAEETLKGMSRAFDKFPSPEMDWQPRASYGISRPALASAGGGGSATVVLQLDGRELGRVVTPYITDEQIVTGQRTQVGIFGGHA